MQYYIARDPDTLLYELSMFLSDRKLLAHYERGLDAIRMGTRYTEEPQDGEAFRRIAYAIKIQPVVVRPECTWVEVRWFLERREFDDPSWRPEVEPAGYEPLWAPALDRFLQERACS